jgi:hypothetical protein
MGSFGGGTPEANTSGSRGQRAPANIRATLQPCAAHRNSSCVVRMKVSFTPKEYGRLLELVHMGLWVAGARPDDPATMPERYGDIAQKAFGLAELFGCADLVESDVNHQLFPSEKLTTGPTREKIDQFVEDAFWGDLVTRLGERDLVSELGATKLSDELNEEEEERLGQIEETYWREFEANGVDHLVVLRGGKG